MRNILPTTLLIAIFALALPTRGRAQCVPFETCGEVACLFGPTILENTTWSNAGFGGNPVPGFCGTLEQDLWFPVVTDTTGMVRITLLSSNCQTGDGLQVALYTRCDTFPVACSQGALGNAGNPLVLEALVNPSQLYFLVVDGFAGDVCDFTMQTIGLAEVGGAGLLTGEVLLDTNFDCVADPSDVPVAQLPVVASGMYNGTRVTDAQGRFAFAYPTNTGFDFSVSIGALDNDLWDWCPDSYPIMPTGYPDTSHLVFLLQPIDYCTDMRIEIGLPLAFRPCQPARMKVSYCNRGTITATDAEVVLVLAPELVVEDASLPFVQTADTLRFALGDVPSLSCDQFEVTVKPLCDGELMGRTLCVEAYIFPDTFCQPVLNWSGAHVALTADCVDDTAVVFRLKNTGKFPMLNVQQYIIIEDEVVLRSGTFQLDAGDEMPVEVTANGATWRMEAGQESGHPGFSRPAVALEGCGGLTPGLINAYPLDDADLFKDIECRIVLAAYDPNIKVASPAGVGSSQTIRPNTPIEYTIYFQNTGTDTAFYVRLVDVLPPTLDPGSFRPGASSHPCSWRILGLDTLEVVFDPIILPDSATNEPASNGWFEFRIAQRPDLPNGTLLQNSAAIYFDYNAPIVTDPAWHTVGQLTVQVDDLPAHILSGWSVLGNPVGDRCTFVARRELGGEPTRFELYDQQGRLLRVEQFSGGQFVFKREQLADGMYFFRLMPAREPVFSGKLILGGRR